MSRTDPAPAPGPSKGFRITGWHVLIGITLFFLIVIAVDVLFVIKAYESFSGQIVKNPYEAGLAFDQRLRDQRHQVALGWQVEAGLVSPGEVVIEVRDRDGAPVTGLSASATLDRPATERGRLTLSFREAAPGVYRAKASPAPGAWDLRAVLKGPAGEPFRAERRITAP